MKKRLIPVLSVLFCLFMFSQTHAQDMGSELITNDDGSYTLTWGEGNSITTSPDGHYNVATGEGNCDGCLPEVVVIGHYNHSTGESTWEWQIPESEITEANYTSLAEAQTMAEMMAYNNDPEPYFQPPSEEEITSAPNIDLHKLFKCFDNVPSAGATYSVKLCADLPVNSDPRALIDNSLSPGHSFVTITKTNGSSSVTQSCGFYPTSGTLSVFMQPGSSKMNDNGGHEYDASITMSNISEADFLTLQQTANNLTSKDYDLNDYNCTDYAVDVFNSVRPGNPITVPDWIPESFNYGETPNGLYMVIKNLSATQSSATTGTANAPASHGLCN